MNIVVFHTPYLDLCLPIIEELKEQGHNVSQIIDPMYANCPYHFNRQVNKKWENQVYRFWEENWIKFNNNIDLFISINGISINKVTLIKLQNEYPLIKRIQYVWDSFNYLHLDQLLEFYDENFTFDIIDASYFSRCKLLPSFYIDSELRRGDCTLEYDCLMIGTNHDKRYEFIKTIKKSINQYSLKTFFKLYVPKTSYIQKIKDFIKVIFKKLSVSEFLFTNGIIDRDILMRQIINPKDLHNYIVRSKCILDDNRPEQAGLSPRFIRAFALQKKILTTNKWVYNYSFVSRNNVKIIDKQSPQINMNFFNYQSSYSLPDNFKFLEIRKWVKILIGEISCPNFQD